MLTLLAEVIPLALAGAISPVVLMGALAILDGPRAALQSAAFSVGVVATTLVLLILGFLVAVARRDGDTPGWFVGDSAHLLIGVMLVVAGIALAVVRPDPRRTEEFQRRFLSGKRPLYDFALAGVVLMITNASTFVVLIAILHVVARANAPFAEEALALSVATFIVVLPATVPLAAALVGGARMRARLGAVSQFAVRYGRFAMAALWIVYGAKDVVVVLLG